MSRITRLLSTGLLTIAVVVGSVAAAGCSSSTTEAGSTATSTSFGASADNSNQPNSSETPAAPGQADLSGQPAPNGQPGMPPDNQTQPGMGGPQGMGFETQITQAAATLGIEEQTLKDAITQAMSELGISSPGDNGTAVPPTGTPPAMSDNGTAPSPDGGQPPSMGGGMPTELLAKVATILGIDQETLSNAFMPPTTPSATP